MSDLYRATTNIGTIKKGEIVSPTDLAEGYDVPWLVSCGSLVPADENEAALEAAATVEAELRAEIDRLEGLLAEKDKQLATTKSYRDTIAAKDKQIEALTSELQQLQAKPKAPKS